MTRVRNESGQTLIFVALAMPVVLGFMGLGIDVGYMRYVKRQVQMAADAAAMAAASEISSCGTPGCSALTTAAETAVSTDNSFPNVTQSTGCSPSPSAGATVVLVNNPPVCLPLGNSAGQDPHNGNNSYVETIVAKNVGTFFARVFGANSATISARAEAGVGNSKNCLYVLDPTGAPSVNMASGSIKLEMPTCNMYIDSSSSDALQIGGDNEIDATSIQIVGSYQKTGSPTLTPTPTTGAASQSDPLSYLVKPTVGSCTYTNYATGKGQGTKTLTAGTYCGGISITNGWSVNLSPGLYILEGGGLNISGSGTTSSLSTGGDGSGGVTFFLTGNKTYAYAPVNIGSGVTVNIGAPTSGTYAGILFFQDSSASGATSTSVNSFNGGSTCTLNGALYFPTTTVDYANGNSSEYTLVVAYDFNVSGNSYIQTNWPAGESPVKNTNAVLGE